MAVTGARLLPDHDVRVVLQGLHELGHRLLAEVSQFFFGNLDLGVGVADDIKGVLHGLGGSLQLHQFVLLVFGNLEAFEHFCLLLVEDLPALFVEHLPWAFRPVHFLVVGDGKVFGRRTGRFLLDACRVGVVVALLLAVLPLDFLGLDYWFVLLSVDFSGGVLFKRGPLSSLDPGRVTCRL